MNKKVIVVGLSGATGVNLGVKILQILSKLDVEVHLIISNYAKILLKHELNIDYKELLQYVDHYHDNKNLSASIASGSFIVDSMIVAPCSINTLSKIANCNTDNLIARAADVNLKERKKLILAVRETPLSYSHIKLMESITLSGGIIAPPVMGSYHHPKSIDEVFNHIAGRIVDLTGIDHSFIDRWNGLKEKH